MSKTIKIDTRTKAARSFLAYAKTLSFVKIEDQDNSNNQLVEKIKNAEKEKGEVMTSAEELWENL